MKLRFLLALAGTLLAVSGCIVAPYGDGGGRGAYYSNGVGEHEYGRRVWRN